MGGVCAAAICVIPTPPLRGFGSLTLFLKGPELLVLPPSLTMSMPEEKEMERERKNFCNNALQSCTWGGPSPW